MIRRPPRSTRLASSAASDVYKRQTQGQYDHLYNIMCSQDEIVQYLNESDDFDIQTFDNLFDNICAAKETYLSNTVKGV